MVAKCVVFQPDPQAARTSARQTGHYAVPKLWHPGEIESLEFDPVKTNQARRRAQPKITVFGLGDGVDAGDGQAVLPAPAPAVVLQKVLGRIKGERADGEQQAQKRRAGPEGDSAPSAFAQ